MVAFENSFRRTKIIPFNIFFKKKLSIFLILNSSINNRFCTLLEKDYMLSLQLDACNSITKSIHLNYSKHACGEVLQGKLLSIFFVRAKYLVFSTFITDNLKWDNHISNIIHKANFILDWFLHVVQCPSSFPTGSASSTRNNNKLYRQLVKSCSNRHHFFTNRVIPYWNELPIENSLDTHLSSEHQNQQHICHTVTVFFHKLVKNILT
ncbi:hypothetical protein BpHYR1_021676 [Brachionus plicatilis]|uniref:RNA-directed DNA polymerase from mobile element jockey-like n=1 Tax=Brachionus plicatilis TaxID=10195 RepID=A0A3M7RUI0_BRAPC|nr:hypothetical protein BpHYR1_021676 [Brachionus plicatilis]